MARTRDIQFVVDEKGRKKSVLMSYKAYLELMEDLDDLLCIADRKDEPRIDLETAIAELKDARKLQS